MAANNNAVLCLTPNLSKSRLVTANTTRDLSVTTNAVLALTPGVNGSRIDRIIFTATAADQTTASAASVLRLYITDAAIANPRLYRELAIAAVTPSSTAIGATGIMNFAGGLIVNSNELVYVTTSVTGGWDCVVEGADF